MATTSYGVNSSEAVKLWRSKLAREALKATWIQKFIGNSSNDILQVFDETSKGAGDRITVTLRMQLNGDGVLDLNGGSQYVAALYTYGAGSGVVPLGGTITNSDSQRAVLVANPNNS